MSEAKYILRKTYGNSAVMKSGNIVWEADERKLILEIDTVKPLSEKFFKTLERAILRDLRKQT